jgi:hypothetical protein
MATTKARPDRIRLSVLEPPCRCREPMMDEAARDREEIPMDVRALPGEEAIGLVLQAVDQLGEKERLRVHTRSLSPAMLAGIQMTGDRFQIIRRGRDGAELLVWRFYSADERRRYLHQAVDGR